MADISISDEISALEEQIEVIVGSYSVDDVLPREEQKTVDALRRTLERLRRPSRTMHAVLYPDGSVVNVYETESGALTARYRLRLEQDKYSIRRVTITVEDEG